MFHGHDMYYTRDEHDHFMIMGMEEDGSGEKAQERRWRIRSFPLHLHRPHLRIFLFHIFFVSLLQHGGNTQVAY